jgi:hypothetical protein
VLDLVRRNRVQHIAVINGMKGCDGTSHGAVHLPSDLIKGDVVQFLIGYQHRGDLRDVRK